MHPIAHNVRVTKVMTASLRVVCLLTLLVNAGIARAATVTGDLKIFVLNIGQGDAILIV